MLCMISNEVSEWVDTAIRNPGTHFEDSSDSCSGAIMNFESSILDDFCTVMAYDVCLTAMVEVSESVLTASSQGLS